MSNRIKTSLRLELSNARVVGDAGNRVWVDVELDKDKLQSVLVYSGYRTVAEGLFSGGLELGEDGAVIQVHNGEPHPLCFVRK